MTHVSEYEINRYRIYAVKAAKRRVLESNQNGYVFACTGSGKTLNSFKLAQLLRDESRVDKVVFLIDRKDIDDQTVAECNSFDKYCAGMPTSTRVPVSQLKDDLARLVVTTIQKMATAVRAKKYENVTDVYRTKRSCDEQQ
ncbi:DEAD/DEAH box helicase family protein [uncultured Actinomyces sp.]|uniref:DEAD/DEAH box helicase family protein n=1 Tax=uncultured Actinomyces sp. TaxID=249061 RepID=UPI0026173B78|nr:DEAD/DEAH box helicase family protein [uncultured Actinomyces sp.]